MSAFRAIIVAIFIMGMMARFLLAAKVYRQLDRTSKAYLDQIEQQREEFQIEAPKDDPCDQCGTQLADRSGISSSGELLYPSTPSWSNLHS